MSLFVLTGGLMVYCHAIGYVCDVITMNVVKFVATCMFMELL